MLYDDDKILAALTAFQNGEMIVVVDDDGRENEGDLVVAAEFCTVEQMAFMIRHSSGIICTPVSKLWAQNLDLSPMVEDNTSAYCTAFTVSIDYKDGTTTGISAHDRALTVNKLAMANSRSEEFVRPGHVFPLIAQDGGVLVRSGHTEAAVDLCSLSGLSPVAVIGELMNDDGTVKKDQQIIEFAQGYNLHVISIGNLILYRQYHEKLVKLINTEKLLEIAVVYKYRLVHTDLIYNVVINNLEIEQDYYNLYIDDPERDVVPKSIYITRQNLFDNYQHVLGDEQHKQARERKSFWLDYGAIAQILVDRDIKFVKMCNIDDEEKLLLYKKEFCKYDIKVIS